jgi:hypothetical protein
MGKGEKRPSTDLCNKAKIIYRMQMKISAVVEILFERYFIAPVVTLDAVKETA